MTNTVFNQVIRNKKIRTLSISLKDLKSLTKLIIAKNEEAIQIEHYQIDQSTAENKDDLKGFVTGIQKVTIFINGREGENFVAYDADIFENHLLPPNITDITIESQTHRQVQAKGDPPNFVRVHFDFARFEYGSPKVSTSGTVINNSILQVKGVNESWVASTFKTLDDRLMKMRNRRTFLHDSGTYQLFLVVVALPTTILLTEQIYRSHQLFFDNLGSITKIGALIYAFLIGIVVYRILYNYALWTFPAVDLLDDRDRSAGHRKFLFSVVTGLLVGFISYYLYRR